MAEETEQHETIDEVAYRLEDYSDDDMAALERALGDKGIAFRVEGLRTIVVAPQHEESVDAVLDEIDVARGSSSDEVDDELYELGDGVALGEDDEAGDHDELIYELVDWSPERRNQLTLVLEREEIAYEWEGADLVVASAVEARVDAILDQIEQGEELAPEPLVADSDELDDEAEYNTLSELFVAADRLSHDPSDLALCGDFVDAAAAAQSLPVPYGIADDMWKSVINFSSAVVQAIDSEAADDVVGGRASTVRDLLRDLV